ncbi:hypothetical protein [Streptomyces mirabilis]|uniref:hypothetical protein n=1 Tax=Streptomyces mirabilis TaxID=68239 RepID=UPI0036EE94EB
MPQDRLDEPSRDRRMPAASQRPTGTSEPEQVSKAASLGMVKGMAMGFGSKAGKWLWGKAEDLKDLVKGD